MKKTLFILILLIISCKSPKNENAESKSVAQLEAKVDSLVKESINPNDPGVAILIAYDGKMLIGKGYGVRNVDTKEPITKSTNMEMASVSKQFTALAILSLVNDGKISLSDTVYKYLPIKSFEKVTIKQLINHTSGLEDAETAFETEWDASKIATNDAILKWYAAQNRTKNRSGQVFEYNNGAYEILPLLVEKVSGENYEAYIKEKVFKKAEMQRTIAFNLNHPVPIDEQAFYYHKDSLGIWNKMDGHPMTGVLGAGGIYTSVDDYFKYDNALRANSIFSKEIHQLIFKKNDSIKTDRMPIAPKMSYAMGWFVNDSTAQHSGGWFGVNTFTKRYLKKPLTVAVFGNRDDVSQELIKKIDALAVQFVNNQNATDKNADNNNGAEFIQTTNSETATKELDAAFKKMWKNVTPTNAVNYFKTDVSDTFFTVNADGIIQNKEQFLVDTERQRMLEILNFKFFDQQIKVFGDVGIINGRIQAFSEETYVGEVFYTAIFVKYNDTWKYENWQGTWSIDSPPPPSFISEDLKTK